MRRSLATLLLMLTAMPARAFDQPVFVDSLVPQKIPVHSFRNLSRQDFDYEHSDSLTGLALRIVEELSQLEGPCRTNLLMKEEEPGSPWLMWRGFARIQAADTPWYAGGLSCADVLCRYSDTESPVEPLLHDRVALVGIGPQRTCVYLLPPEPATIGDHGSAAVASAGANPGKGYVVIQVLRVVDSEHPCYDGGDHVSYDERYFMVLRGDSLVQSFKLVPRHEWYSHDDADGDLDTKRTASLSVSATLIRMAYQVEETQHSTDVPDKTRTRITQRGVIELAYDERSGRFRRRR